MSLKARKKGKRNLFDSDRGCRTFDKHNGIVRVDTSPQISDFDEDYTENDALLDSLWEQTEEEMQIVDEYLYPTID